MQLTRGAVLLGDAVTQARDAKPRISQATLAARVGVKQQTISNWKHGKSIPRGQTLGLLEREFGIPPIAWAEVAATKRGRGRRPGARSTTAPAVSDEVQATG